MQPDRCAQPLGQACDDHLPLILPYSSCIFAIQIVPISEAGLRAGKAGSFPTSRLSRKPVSWKRVTNEGRSIYSSL